MKVRNQALPADVLSARKARRFAVDVLESWNVVDVAHDVELCVGELVSNVVLHARTPVWVSLQLHDDALVVEVRDNQRTDLHLPSAGRTSSAATEAMAALDAALVANATTGRGLLVVAAIADDLGIDVDASGKTIWFSIRLEPEARGDAAPSRRRVGDLEVRPTPAGRTRISFRGLPVRTSLANGANVDDLAREIRLMTLGRTRRAEVTSDELETFDRLLHRTAPGRLAGRRLARQALAAGQETYDLEVVLGRRAVDDLVDLNAKLQELDQLARSNVLLCPPAGDDVLQLRTWLAEEIARQLAGDPARSYV